MWSLIVLFLWFLVTFAFLPMRLSSRRSMSLIVTFSKMTQYARLELRILEPFPTLVYGPMKEFSITVSFPITQGPLMVLAAIFASASILTRPSVVLLVTVPLMSRSMYSSSIFALAERISSFLPVSSHHELRISALTLKPMFTISWRASVISSSPRQEGFIRSIARCTLLEKMYVPIMAKLPMGVFGFSTRLIMLPFWSTWAMPKREGSSTSFRIINASRC